MKNLVQRRSHVWRTWPACYVPHQVSSVNMLPTSDPNGRQIRACLAHLLLKSILDLPFNKLSVSSLLPIADVWSVWCTWMCVCRPLQGTGVTLWGRCHLSPFICPHIYSTNTHSFGGINKFTWIWVVVRLMMMNWRYVQTKRYVLEKCFTSIPW